MKKIDDVGRTISIPDGCRLETVAVYDDDEGHIDTSLEIWSAMDSLNQAALIAHEIIYREYRAAGDRTSQNTRAIVARVFSTTPPMRQKEGIPQSAHFCHTSFSPDGAEDAFFYLFQSPANESKTVVQFIRLFGRTTFAPLKIEIPQVIDLQQTEIRQSEDSIVSIVTNPLANMDNAFPLIGDGLFPGYSVSMRYLFNEPILIGLHDDNGNELQKAPIDCTTMPK